MDARKIAAIAQELYPDIILDLEALVNMDSVSEDVEGLQTVVDYLVPLKLGLTPEVEWQTSTDPLNSPHNAVVDHHSLPLPP